VTLSVPYPVTNINSVEEKNNTVNVAGREFIPDEKKLSSYH
jgi:hypothetical protein